MKNPLDNIERVRAVAADERTFAHAGHISAGHITTPLIPTVLPEMILKEFVKGIYCIANGINTIFHHAKRNI